ncbi:hypothetical protein ACFWBB_37040 [Streptomyces sp. NPDC060000]|uniref:hypothetical protein n=1 Tax=Streptomyces sp. NPDC060000 TaxID=3347031 RepID=UPI003698E00D
MGVAGRDLRALFSTNDRSVQADEAFTNRASQWETVAAALTEHIQRISAPGFDAEDLEAPRNHVLVFHGVGGIGKTTLSRMLEAALTDAGRRPSQWGEPGWPADRILPVRIDLARSAGTDFEQIVLTIRAALTRIGRPLPAFDLALRRYWEANHPGEPLEEYLRRGGLGSRFGQALPQQMQSALADVAQALMLPGTIGSAVGQVTGALIGALRERRQTVRALAGCARLADLLEAEPDLDALSFYPHLLAWELARLPEGKRVVPVVLLDTFEDIGDRTRRDLERLIQRTVWLLPNAFWIVTGRSRLQWADPALQGQLDYTGPAAWPGLVHTAVPAARTSTGAGTARQVLIGEPIRQVITARSHGLPLYLDLSVARFLELSRSGRTPQPGNFDHDFPALVARTLTDLTPDERHVLRSVSLLDAFDVPLATQAAGLTHEGPALRLTERPFVRDDPFGLWPFNLHGLIRSAVRNADDTTDDRWTDHDWQQAAQRALATLGEQYQNAPGPDRLLLIACLRQGLRLARDHRLDLDWLTLAAWTYISDSVWEPLAPPDTDAGAGLGTPAGALVELLSTLARASTNTALEPSADSPPSSTPTCCPATYRKWRSTTAPSPFATPAVPPNPAGTTSRSPTRAAASHQPPAAAWPTPRAWRATSLPPSPPPRTLAGKAATTACWATCTGSKANPSAPPRRTSPDAPKPNSTARPARPPTTRPCAHSPSRSTPPTRPPRKSTSPTSSWSVSTCAPPPSTSGGPNSSAMPAATASTIRSLRCAPNSISRASPRWPPRSSWPAPFTRPSLTIAPR